jgi:hypothetical protein
VSLKTARRRAEALNRLYGTDQARPSHSVWFVKNHIEYLPLVKAMARVIGMERQMGFDRSSRADALDLADLHTTRSVILSDFSGGEEDFAQVELTISCPDLAGGVAALSSR